MQIIETSWLSENKCIVKAQYVDKDSNEVSQFEGILEKAVKWEIQNGR